MSDDYPRRTLLDADDESAKVQAELRRLAALKDAASDGTATIESEPFRPTNRAPMAILTALDDGQRSGEVIRIRGPQFLIGRAEGDLKLGDDEQVSSRHVLLEKKPTKSGYRLSIRDMNSRNGVFFKVAKAPLEHLSEFIVGSGCYRFEAADDGETTPAQNASHKAPVTMAFGAQKTELGPSIVEIHSSRSDAQTILMNDQCWIGRSLECEIRRMGDPFACPQHALIRKSSSGRWSIENNKSVNGLWFKMPKVSLEVGQRCEFRIGEQIFQVKFG